jgi:magnesium-protoporphyrin O-methyltransferase
MPCDCSKLGLDEVFGERSARHDVNRFIRRGLPRRSRKLLDAVQQITPVTGAETLEIGAGAGGLSVTLIERGAVRAMAVDASPAFAAAARSLADRRGIADRLVVVAADFAAHSDATPPADVVMLDRVICCYPDLPALLLPAVARARRVIALSYPRNAWWSRLLVRAANAGLTVTRRRFRMQFHRPDRVRTMLEEGGFTSRVAGHVGVWELLVASRAGPAGHAR